MSHDLDRVEDLGREVAELLGPGPGKERLAAQARSLQSLAPRHVRPPRFPFLAPAGAFAVCAACILVIWLDVTAAPSFWVGKEGLPGVYGRFLQAASGEPLSLRFEGETRGELAQNSSCRIYSTQRGWVRMALGQGTLSVVIQKQRAGKRWMVEGGPFTVTAKGTRFSVHWDGHHHLEVAVQEGVVEIKGPGLGREGRLLGAGEAFQGDSRTDPASANPGGQAPPSHLELARPAANPQKSTPVRPAKTGSKTARVASAAQPGTPAFLSLHREGRFEEAVAAAEATGLRRLLSELDEESLWALAESARNARRAEVASLCLRTIRERWAKSWRATLASFLLGRVAEELDERYDLAARWYEQYLKEDPAGSLAEEALGRKIDALRKAGSQQEARQAAQGYLEKYPDGLFVPLARGALQP